MTSLRAALVIFAAASLPLGAQETKKPDDVLQKRDGGILVGRILKIESETVEFFANGEKEPRRIAIRDLMPYSVYRMRLERVDKTSGPARFELGEYCMIHGLYSTAAREFEEAGKLDKSLEEKARKRREEAHVEDGRAKFEEAKKLHTAKNYEAAKDILRILIDKYGDTPYADEARKLDAKMAEEIAKESEEKKKMLAALAAEKEKAKEKVKEDQDKLAQSKTVELIEEAQKLWAEGLDHEPKNLTKADRAWTSAEQSLLRARAYVEVLLRSNDVETIKKAKDLERQVDLWLVKTYYRLGRMWAVELAYPKALEWLNKGLKVPHDDQMDHLLNEVLLQISLKKISERAAGRGY
jgi:tetratricopeptide (TPR) repeat protein